MYISFAYNLKISSEFPLLDPISYGPTPDIVVRFGALGPDATGSDQSRTLLVRLPLGLKLWVCDGNEIIVDAPPDLDLSVVRAHVLGVGMALIMRQRGFLVLHASCVAKGEKAIAFLGAAGWGKSTLASIFHQQGYRLITDDVMAIQMSTSTPTVIPSFPEVKLLPDAAAVLREPTLHRFGPKQIQRLDSQFSTHPAALQQLYVLRLGEYNHIEPMKELQGFIELIQHSRAVKTLSDPAVQVQHFHQCSALAKSVPMGYLKRPRSLDQLPQVVKMIEADLEDLRTQPAFRGHNPLQ